MAWTKEKQAAYDKKRYEENKEKKAAYNKKYSQTVEGKYTTYKSCSKYRNIPFNISLEEFQTFWQVPCYYCGDEIETIGIDRIDSSLGYEVGNLRSCCNFCNLAKNNNSEEYFLDKILKISALHCSKA